MGLSLRLPPELIALIIDLLHGDTAALKACSLVSHTFLPLSQVHLLEKVRLRFRFNENIGSMRGGLIPVLSHTWRLSISYSDIFIVPSSLDGTLDHFMAFRNVRELRIHLDTFHFVDRNLRSTSRYFSHFQPTCGPSTLRLLTQRTSWSSLPSSPCLKNSRSCSTMPAPKRHGIAG